MEAKKNNTFVELGRRKLEELRNDRVLTIDVMMLLQNTQVTQAKPSTQHRLCGASHLAGCRLQVARRGCRI